MAPRSRFLSLRRAVLPGSAALAFALAGLGPATAAAQDLRIGYVDTAQVMERAPQAAEVDERLIRQFLPREQELLAKQQEIADLEARLKREGPAMTATDRRRLEREIRLKLSQYKFEEQEFREDRNIRRNEEIRGLQKIVYDAIVEIAKRESYDLVLTNGVSYASGRTDLTDVVIEKLKRQYRPADAKANP